ncbi:transglycosylase SLT domain-containing protein [Pandoraea sp.]|uniref:transglycosylase SLT domain-containing protein n=1 Tax=Pandoraea sp. TaxID=1883445 RepID=UPI0012232245|nr:transglycosylase SLT domain-containing protein [Pandoraea sp.]TAL53583.1 MAG: invasion protein IagB [Pandoraea sp.]TAM14874.1 MAG: invasion protein IagB [Pandoraea sp.]
MQRVLKWLAAGALCAAVLPAYADCWREAGARYHIDPALLYAMAHVESGLDPKARNKNRDGTRDIGLMQINSRHLPRLAKFGITEKKLLDEPCTSVMVGAWILADFIRREGYNWRAVGAYNAGTAPNREFLRQRYAQKVWARYGPLRSAPMPGAVAVSTREP